MNEQIKNIDELTSAALIIDYNHKIHYANKQLVELIGKNLNDIIGKYCYNVITCDLCFKNCPFLQVFEQNKNFEEKNIKLYDEMGNDRNISYSMYPYNFNNMRTALITIETPSTSSLVSYPDINIKHIDDEINVYVYYSALINLLDEGIVFVDKNYNIIECNSAMENITGYQRQNLLGQPCPNICHIPEGYSCPFDYCIKNNKDREEIYSVISRKNESPIVIKVLLNIIRDKSNEIYGGIGIVKKILDYEKLREDYDLKDFVAENKVLKEALSMLAVVAFSNNHLLITGETGTGRKLLASKLKVFYSKPDMPVIIMNTEGLDETQIEKELFGYEKDAFEGAINTKIGKLELASNGLLILNEVTNLSLNIQNKLYDALKEGYFKRLGGKNTIKCNAKIIAISSKDIKMLLEKNQFSLNLYNLISFINIYMPPLRDRVEDIFYLVEHFLTICRKSSKKEKNLSTISSEALQYFTEYKWPGNVQELKTVIEYIYLLAPSTKKEITVDMIPDNIRETVKESLKIKFYKEERQHIIDSLRLTNLDRTRAAQMLGMSRITLWRKIKYYKITVKEILQI